MITREDSMLMNMAVIAMLDNGFSEIVVMMLSIIVFFLVCDVLFCDVFTLQQHDEKVQVV